MAERVEKIIGKFNFAGELVEFASFGNGNINDTYLVRFANHEMEKPYILQKINGFVFSEPWKLIENTLSVTRHLREKIRKQRGDPDRETLTLIESETGNAFYRDDRGEYWCAYLFIDHTKAYDKTDNPWIFYQAGKAFGRFQCYLSDYPAHTLYETIPDFHNTKVRYEAFLEAVKNDTFYRAESVRHEIDFVCQREGDTGVITDLLCSGQIPLRVTHNDTKLNNVLMDSETMEGVCVIDLDTVMPGSALYDFGDAIRSGANKSTEDEQDIAKVQLDMELFEAFTKGFLGEVTLTPTEIEYLPFSAKLISLELGMRFLTNYLNGDKYFKPAYEG
ncbi:MAG: mucin desulfatase, partial [Clostridiales bacterium 43-6]